jgi:rod shape-determining protein MreD
MTTFRPILILIAAFLAVFWEAAFPGTGRWLKAQVDLLPPLMVYASLRTGLPTIALLAVCGGLFFDSLSANPTGVSILPLFAVGVAIYWRRELVLRDQPYAQFVLGLAASAATPILAVLLLLTAGQSPLLGWGSLWQWLVMSLGGAIAAPIFFLLFAWCERALGHRRVTETSFRPNREIRRGRS